MSPKKYVSLSKLSTFLDNLYNKFSLIGHKHTLSDITNYTVDSQLSSTSTNPVQNNMIDAEFEAMSIAMNVLEEAIDGKANSTHTHSDIYYTKGEVDNAIDAAADELQENINTVSAAVELLTNGASADEIDSVNDLIDYVNEHGAEVTGMKADIAANTKAIADQATLDAATYEKKTDASAKLAEAKSYTDQKIAAIPTPDVSAQIATHNTSSTAHADIRDEIVASQSVIMGTINAAATEFSASWLSNINPSEDKIYVVKDENMLCRWDGTSYVRLNVGIPTKSTYKFTATNATNTFTIPTSVTL